MQAPPSPIWWELDGYLRGHTVDETLGYLAHCADFADEQTAVRPLPANVITVERAGWLDRLRDRLGR